MPRIKKSLRDKAFGEFEGLLVSGMKSERIDRGELNRRMGFSDTRMRTIRSNPLKATFEDIGKLSDILGIPEERFHEVLRNVPRR